MLSTNKKKSDGTLVHIKLPNVLPEAFQIILGYIYSGKISLNEYDASDIIRILLTGSEFEDFKTLKNNIRQCIPFIKFHNLTSREFSDKVLPYRKVLPKELLYDDLLKYFMNLDSQPIKDSKPPLKDSNEILGGYNPIAWESGGYDAICEKDYKSTKDSFIFSFNNNDNIEIYTLSRVKYEKFAILNHYNSGPVFGIGDLALFGDFGNCYNNNYEKQIRETTDIFFVEEYEIFQIIPADWFTL
ncbi:BTB/POZ protein [Rhizophagus irregularis DAOM 181602=DAOM 197198]|nr:BTB/POZ protein [Rhizophagus irregularis DAOM 181602=DAOM 197198]